MGGAGLIGHTGRHAHGALGDAPHPNARPPPVERAVRQLRGRHCDPHCSLLNEQHLPQPTQRPLCTSPSTQLPFSPALISRPSRAAACGERRGQVREFTRGIGEPGPHANVTQPLPGPNIGETPPLNRATFGRVLKHSPPKGLLRQQRQQVRGHEGLDHRLSAPAQQRQQARCHSAPLEAAHPSRRLPPRFESVGN
jgi:hypothetical protein